MSSRIGFIWTALLWTLVLANSAGIGFPRDASDGKLKGLNLPEVSITILFPLFMQCLYPRKNLNRCWPQFFERLESTMFHISCALVIFFKERY